LRLWQEREGGKQRCGDDIAYCFHVFLISFHHFGKLWDNFSQREECQAAIIALLADLTRSDPAALSGRSSITFVFNAAKDKVIRRVRNDAREDLHSRRHRASRSTDF
jgi:hypothetical protein